MLPGIELMGCHDLAVPAQIMRQVVRVESSFNPYAIGVVGGRLERQPRSLSEAVATAQMLEAKGYNFSLGLAQVNRHNLGPYGLPSYAHAFEACPNLRAGARILAECHGRSGNDWGKSLSCYYSGNFVTGLRHGYVQKVLAQVYDGDRRVPNTGAGVAIPLVDRRGGRAPPSASRIAGRSHIQASSQQAPLVDEAADAPQPEKRAVPDSAFVF